MKPKKLKKLLRQTEDLYNQRSAEVLDLRRQNAELRNELRKKNTEITALTFRRVSRNPIAQDHIVEFKVPIPYKEGVRIYPTPVSVLGYEDDIIDGMLSIIASLDRLHPRPKNLHRITTNAYQY